MSFSFIKDIEVKAISTVVPRKTVKIADLPVFKSRSESRRFEMAVGISSLRLDDEWCASDYCYFAAKRIFDAGIIEQKNVKVLLFISQSPDVLMPATACILHKRLGLSSDVIAFDINLGCSGYTYGLQVAAALLSSLKYTVEESCALILCGDNPSRSVNKLDPATAPLFSDCGTATVLTRSPFESSPTRTVCMNFKNGTDGEGWEAINVRAGYRNGFDQGIHMYLDGSKIFQFSTKKIPEEIKTLLVHSKVTHDKVDKFVFHQANKLINNHFRKSLELTEEQCPSSLEIYGNTISGTIPITITECITQEDLNKKQAIHVLCGFGVGLSWCSMLTKGVFENTKVLKCWEL